MNMGHVKIKRQSRSQSVTVGTSTASSTSARCEGMAAAMLIVSGHTASATFTVWGSSDGVTFSTLYGSDGSGSTLPIPATAAVVAMPDSVFGSRFVRLTTDAALSTSATVIVGVKS